MSTLLSPFIFNKSIKLVCFYIIIGDTFLAGAISGIRLELQSQCNVIYGVSTSNAPPSAEMTNCSNIFLVSLCQLPSAQAAVSATGAA